MRLRRRPRRRPDKSDHTRNNTPFVELRSLKLLRVLLGLLRRKKRYSSDHKSMSVLCGRVGEANDDFCELGGNGYSDPC